MTLVRFEADIKSTVPQVAKADSYSDFLTPPSNHRKRNKAEKTLGLFRASQWLIGEGKCHWVEDVSPQMLEDIIHGNLLH